MASTLHLTLKAADQVANSWLPELYRSTEQAQL